MATKLQFYSALAERTLEGLTSKRGSWTKFLDSAAWLYKYPFHDQVMIHAQRPDATACAEIELWNEQFNRWVRRGSKGIALIDDSGSYPRLRYVFDVSDTEAALARSRPVKLWEMRREHKDAVLAELAKSYEDVSSDDSLADTFHNIARQLAREYYEDNAREIFYRSENSILEPPASYDFAGTLIEDSDDTALRARFEEMLASSVAYVIMARCGLDPAEYFDEEEFQGVIDFNTPDMATALGVATSDLSEQVLRDVWLTVRKFERNKYAERSENTHDRNANLHAGRGLSAARPEAGRASEGAYTATGPLREDAQSLPQGAPADNLQPPAAGGDTVSPSEGDRRGGDGENDADDDRADGEDDAARQGDRPDGVDGGDERPESAGGGNRPHGTDLQLNEPGAAENAAPLPLPEPPQAYSQLGNSSLEEILSTSAVSMAEVDAILRDGSNDKTSTLRIAAHFAKGRTASDNAAFLRREFLQGRWGHGEHESGKGFDFGNHRVCAWFDADGISLAIGITAKRNMHRVNIPWEVAAERVKALYDTGQYVSQETLKEALLNESRERANDVIELYNNISRGLGDIRWELRKAMTEEQKVATENDWKRRRYLIRGLTELDRRADDLLNGENEATPDEIMALYNETLSLSEEIPEEWAFGKGHPEIDEQVTELLHDKGEVGESEILHGKGFNDLSEYALIVNRLKQDIAALADEPDAPIRFWRNPHRVLRDLEKAGLPAHGFPDAKIPAADFKYFITQDEVDSLLTRGGSYSEGKMRFLSFFLGDHDDKEKLEFIKREYGHGGGTHSATDGWHQATPGGGLTLSRGTYGNAEVSANLKWPAVIKRTEQLIFEGRYMTRAELDRIPNYEKLMLMRSISNFYHELPPEYERPFVEKGSFSYMARLNGEDRGALDFHYPREAEWAFVHSFLSDDERIDATLAQMKHLFENTSTEDRYYALRKNGYESLAAFRAGTYTLFPGLENLPDPETALVRRITPRTEQIEDLSDGSVLNAEPENIEQMSIFDIAPPPLLPSVEEQQAKIEASQPQEPEIQAEAELEAPAVSLPITPEEIDTALLLISDVDKTRLAAQLAVNPRSREAVSLVREIYGSIAATTQRTDGSEGYLGILGEKTGVVISRGAAAGTPLRERPPAETLMLPWAALIKRMAELAADGRLAVTEAEREAPPPIAAGPIPEPAPTPPPLDFDTVAQTALARAMADSDYAEALASAASRAALRNPCTRALEQSIRDHEADEPQVYERYFSDEDFNDALFDYVLKQSWAQRPQPEVEVPLPQPAVEPEAQSPSYQLGDTFYMDGNPYVLKWIGHHEISYSEPDKPFISKLMDRAEFERLLQEQPLSDVFVDITDPDIIAEIDEIFGGNDLALKEEKPDEELYGGDDDTPESAQPPAPAGPRYEVKTLTAIEQIQSNPPVVSLLEPGDNGRRYGIYDNEAGRYLHKPDGSYIVFHTQAAAQAYIDSLTKGQNFRITDDHLGEGGAKTKFRNNMNALQTLSDIEFEHRTATPEEQEILSRYVGWGGLPQAFDPDNKGWENEYLELDAMLSPEDWASARASTLNAHYTSPVVIKAMYETLKRLGFQSGNILEPSCGVGNFFGLLPESMQNSKLYGVELDSVTARIAKQLYPKADIQQTGFENTQFSDAFFDVAIGNVPFGSYGVADKRYDKHNFSIHNYFFAKTLDKVRPGGVIALLTSKFTMDERNPKARKYIAQRAELLGAVRLPNDAFLKNAGTETTMDILFLQKRDRPVDIEPEWVHLGTTEDGIPCNRYFIDNPEMVLGTMGLFERMNNKFGRDDYTCCIPTEGADLGEQLQSALSHIQGEYVVSELDDLEGVDNHAIPADPDVKNFSYTEVDGTVYFRENSLMYPVDLPAMTMERIKGMIGLRDCVHELIALQLDDYPDEAIKSQQDELNTLYDGFVAEFGLLSSNANSRAFNADSAYYLLSSLEVLDEEGELERKADMFTKRTIRQRTVISHVDTASEALAVSLSERARIDLDYMSELTGFDREKLLEDLQGVIYLNIGAADSQMQAYVTADEYLSGNVRQKLALAEAAAATVPSLQINVDALKAVQPKDLEANEISVRLGSTWIEPKYIQEFMYELLNTSWRNKNIYQVKYHQYTGEWQVTGKGKGQFNDIPATVTYGTSRMNAYQILDDTLNLRDVRVYDYKEDADGKEQRVLNKKETMLAQQKQELIKQKFRDWIWQDPERRQTLVRQYNDRFNSMRPREYDGSHITFSGMNPEIKLYKHQMDAVARHLYGGNALYAHVVGAGKTITIVAAAQESKRLGLCQKSLIAVPNHLTEQWATEYLRLYPAANILVATKKDFEMRNRKKFCAKIATGDYDAVIIGHSQLEKIPMSRERQERQMRDQIWEVMQGIQELRDNNGERFSIKQLEKTKRGLEHRLKKLLESKTRDDVVTFEQLGVDRLFVDESHNFKNLFLYTKMRNVAGLSTSEAQKSSDLFMKCRYMDEITGNKGIVFATGTPISNSMSEMYTTQRYLQYATLAAMNLLHFDAWASIFGETVTSIELAPEGTGYRARTRFARFHNLPELMTMFKEVADIQTSDMLNLPVPEALYENIIVEPSELQKEMVQELSERAAAVQRREVDPSTDNMLKITTDGRKIGLDQRLMNPLLPDDPGSKVNACADGIFETWQDTRADRLTQLVFCDFSTPNKDGRFNVYDDIKLKLLERGIPESEVAFIHDADTETRKKELFAKVRQGKVRVLFGSTFKMGTGTNVQDRIIELHDLDCPWRPSDLEQRAGRGIRQGNLNPKVRIKRYATSGTFDSYLWQTVQKKQEFIAQIMSSKSPVRSCEDVDETALSYAEIKALCAGNPLIAEKMNLDNEVAKLRMLKAEHQSQRYRLEDDLMTRFPEQITAVNERIAGIEKDIATYTAQKERCAVVETDLSGNVSASTAFPGMTINGTHYAEKEPASKALLEACKGIIGMKTDVAIGEYMGFKMSLRYESFGKQINLLMRGAMTYQLDLGTDALGNISRINHSLDKLPERLEGAKAQLDTLNGQVEAAKLALDQTFDLSDELEQKEARLALLNADLNIDGQGDMDILNDTEARDASAEYEDSDEPDYEDFPSNYSYAEAQMARAVNAKAKPSILDGLRGFSGDKGSDVPSGVKPLEHEI